MTTTVPAVAPVPVAAAASSGSRRTTVLGWAALVLVGATSGLGLTLPKSIEQDE